MRIQVTQGVASMRSGKLPRNGTSLGIALHFERINASTQCSHAVHASRETGPLENTDLNFGHIEPASMFWGIMELNPSQDTSSFSRRKSFIESGRSMGVEIILDQTNAGGLGIGTIDQPTDTLGIIELGAPIGHFHMTPSSSGFDQEKEIGRSQTLIFIIHPFCLSRGCRQRRSNISMRSYQLLIQTDRRIAGIVFLFIEIKHIFHRCHKLCTYFWDAPLLVLPRFELIFFNSC